MNLRLSGRLLARKALLNFIGQAVPLLVGVVTIPFTVQCTAPQKLDTCESNK